jgi:hypothetical protein|tara:strand:+ start:319 stop:450 length:132 start_codon:yes stop_codon:yes gene_type:complete
MEHLLAKQILELEARELEDILMKLKMENNEAYNALQELLEDHI